MSTEITAEVRAEWRRDADLILSQSSAFFPETIVQADRIVALLDALDAEERVGQEHVESLAEDCEEQRIRAERAEAKVARVEVLVPVFEAKYGIQSSPVSLLTAALAGPSPTDEPRKRWLSDREYVIDNPSPTDEGGEGA